jgi:tetrahydromethanopterin S-methyltransferase subunit E
MSKCDVYMKDCPKCKLVNPDIAERCDCGYDFPTGSMQSSYLTAKDRRRRTDAIGGVIAFFLVLRFAGVARSIQNGVIPAILAIGLLVLFILAVVNWSKYSSRSNSD